MELLAATLGFVVVVGLLWTTGRVAPESLITTPWFRTAWILAVIAVLRPITWLPYLAVFLGIRRIETVVAPDARLLGRNLLAHAATVGLAIVVIALVALAIPGAGRRTM